MIDVGHTPQSLRVVASALRRIYRGKPILLVTGVSEDKDIPGILSELTPIASEIVCTRAYHKGAPVASILDICRSLSPDVRCSAADTIEEAMEAAQRRAAAGRMAIVVAGGLFLAIEALVSVKGEDPQELRFF